MAANLRCLSLGKAGSMAEESKLGNISGSVGAIFVHQACCSPAKVSKSGCHKMLQLLYNCLGVDLLSFAMLSVALENALLTSSSVRISFTCAHLRCPFESTEAIYYKCVSQRNDQLPTSLAHPAIDGH